MAEQKESSVLFSLKELMNLEEDRIKQEEDQKRRAEEEAARVRAEAERRVREEEEARIRADQERRRGEEQRVREETARLEAIRHAEVEKARVEAENQARIEQLRHQQEHERHLVALTQDKSKKRLVFIASGIGVVFVAGLIGGAVVISNQLKKAHDLEAQLSTLQSEADENNKKMADLQSKLGSSTSPEERAALEKQLEEAQKKQQELASQKARVQSGGPAVHTGGATHANLPKCGKCAQGDPLCSEVPNVNCTP